MIKENKEKQREKNGSTTTIKTELPGSQVVPTSEATVKEEPGTESHVNEGEEGDGSCKKSGMRLSGSSTPSTPSSCSHPDLKPNLITSTNVGTVAVGTSSQGSTDLCIPDSTPEVPAKSEESASQEKPSSCSAIKSEINGNTSHDFPNNNPGGASTPGDACDGVLSVGISIPSSAPPPNGVQPLPSNVINKQPGTMEAQYMQQQSQIFVFSTALANKSAEAVLQGQYPSIIAYHCAQPGTKKYLENSGNNNSSNNNSASSNNNTTTTTTTANNNNMNNTNNMITNMNSVGTGGNHVLQPCASGVMSGGPVSSSLPGGPLKAGGIDSPCLLSGSPNTNPMLPSGIGHHSPNIPASSTPLLPGAPDMAGSPVMNHGNLPQPSLTGVKVPDENLTPQQRQHREEQLATLRKMQQMLFPEHPAPIPEGGNVGQHSEGMVMHGLGPILSLGPNGGMVPQKNMMLGNLSGPNQMTPTSAAAQIEWQKLQHQFYEERKKKSSSGLVMTTSGSGLGSPIGSSPQQSGPASSGTRSVPGQGPRTQGPPPPYHQTTRSASVPTAMPSPNPSSPNNPTSNLSLPSPRATSGLNSPSESNRSQFGVSGGSNGSNRLLGPGPSPTGIHNTSIDSPTASRPLNASNPSTPVSTHLSPTASRKDGLGNGSEFSALTQGTGSQSISTTISNQPPVDGMFCRTLQSLAQQKQQQLPNSTSKEPNLMPVPSPQQIQYLNTFEGQELTIQKQPNTSLKDTNIRSPSLPPSNIEGNMQSSSTDITNTRMSGPGTPLTPTSVELGSRFPPTSGDVSSRFPIPSPHTPGSESKSQQRFPGPSPQSQGSRTPGMEQGIKTPTTEVGPRFLSASPQMGDGMAPPRCGGPTGTSPAMANQSQNFMHHTPPSIGTIKVAPHFLDVSPSSNTSAAVDVSPTGPNNFSCLRSENVPLNPNGSGGMPCNGKMAHFDPITSMAQMSQQLTSSVSNSPGAQNSGLIGSVPGGPCSSGMLPFNSNAMHPMQMNDMGSCTGLPDAHPGGLVNPMGGAPSNQPGPGNFVSIQLQNVPPHSYSPNSSVGGSMVPCSSSVNTTACMNQPIAHPNSSGSPKPGSLMMGLGPPRGSSPYSSSPVPQRMIGRPPGPSPYNGANVQVKASAPNTIQYLPAKPQAGNSGPRGPPSLDFLQRFANPLSNLDSKVPTHNLQYFPSNGQSNTGNMGGLSVPMNRPNGLITGMSPQMNSISGPNCGGVGGHVGPMNSLNGPMMGPNGSLVGMNLPMSSGMVMGPGGPGIGMVPLRGGLRPGGIMRMQQIGSGVFGVPSSPGQPVGGDQMFGGGPAQNMPTGGPNSQVFVPGSKASPMGLSSTPDASQPLPPSMGQSNNFKNSPFIGPTTADPNYAQQFHNFQQQLYATNTRSQINNQNVGPNQSFFVPK
ncbi:protein BCL9 homolog isoform X2 [Anabrus simplex]|uniref:protein BCL9 homolog isoform X2 n=1 Tax=Anabrus simplex TaxID=316456 RepID=UPI0035A3B794